jgi:hypothetical protein
MKNPLDYIRPVPQELVEAVSFLSAVLAGSVYKMIHQNKKGIKITVKTMLVEAFSSFFIAIVVYAVLNQFLQFNTFFTYMMCSLAGSMDTLIHSKIEALIDVAFNAAKKKIN